MANGAGAESPRQYSWNPTPEVAAWLAKITQLLSPAVDTLEQLPARARRIFHYDPTAALADPDNADVLSWPHTDAVFSRFTIKILSDESARAGELTAECFKTIVNEVKAETGAKGKELFHPVRIVVTGSHSGPDFDRLVPILEEGSRLQLPKHVLSVKERVEEFAKARGK
jgi:nondiscriminating glutamyl-tRNA synthetase